MPILLGTKRPPERFPLKRYFSERPDEATVRRSFAEDRNIGVVLGDVSDGLSVRDFDSQASYRRWAADHPRLAETLPTAATARGYHVYFTADPGDVRDVSPTGGTIIPGPDGELKAGGYVLAPCSIHPTGKRYEWITPPDLGAPFIGDLLRAGLVPRKPGKAESVTHPPCVTSLCDFSLCDTSDRTRQRILTETLPTGPYQSHDLLFRLARRLKALPSLKDQPVEAAEPMVRQWFDLAKPQLADPDWQDKWRDFRESWSRIVPGQGSPEAIAKRLRAEHPNVHPHELLVLLCRELQAANPRGTFFLSCRDAASSCGFDHHKAAWRYMGSLQRKGVVELVRRGTVGRRGRANEYRWSGDRDGAWPVRPHVGRRSPTSRPTPENGPSGLGGSPVSRSGAEDGPNPEEDETTPRRGDV